MLSLRDPVEFEDLVVHRDDEDARKFYLLPDQPVISVDDQGAPDFLFIKYLKDVGETPDSADVGGGWVQFRSALTEAPERRQRVEAALRQRLIEEKAAGRKPLGLTIDSTEPLLAKPLYREGKVSLATFKTSDTGLVRHATETANADLTGDLGASFGLELDPDGAEIFWSAFKGWREQQIPILISYQLTYKARVSASMSIHAKRQVIQQHIWQVARPYRMLRTPFIRYVPHPFAGVLTPAALATLRTTVREPIAAMVLRPAIIQAIGRAITENTITVRIKTDEIDAGPEGSKVQEALFKLATDLLTERVVPAIFGTDTALPGADAEGDRSAGRSLMRLRDDDRDNDVSFDFELDHETTVERSVNPNGPVQVLLDKPGALEGCFRELRLADGFFSLMRVAASTAGVDFERDGIELIHVFFRYEQQDESNPARPWVRRSMDGTLRSAKDTLFWRFDTTRDATGGHKREYEYRIDVFYRQGPPSATDWTRRSDRMLLITPRAMGALRVELVLTAGKAIVDSCRVALRHQAMNGKVFETTITLDADANRKSWFQFTGDLGGAALQSPEYSYQVQYLVGGSRISLPPRSGTDQTLEIPGPFAKTIGFTVMPRGAFDGVGSITGEIVYDDPRYGYQLRGSFQLAKLTDSFRFQVPVLEGGPEEASWTARIVNADGSGRDLPPGKGLPGTVWVGAEVDDFLVVEVLPDLIDFERDVELALVKLSYADPDHAIAETHSFTFSKAAHASQVWKVARPNRRLGRYDAHIRYIAYDRARSSEVDLRQIEEQVLVLDRAAAPA